MIYLLAALPILLVLALMLVLHWGGQRAGPAGWAAGLVVAAIAFGLTPSVFWVSQGKGLFLSAFVLAVLWPALLLYNVVAQIGGIRALAVALERTIQDRALLLLALAWSFSGMLDGLAGFGLPIAIVAPMLAGLGVEPVVAVAAVAVGHAWSVTFGDMGVIYAALIGIVKMDPVQLAPVTALLLGMACFACGVGSARLLGERVRMWVIVLLAAVMGVVQFVLAVSGLTPLAALGAGLAGTVAAVALTRPNVRQIAAQVLCPELYAALTSYGVLAALMTVLALLGPWRAALDQVMWQIAFPQVETSNGFVTPAGMGQTLRFLTHPGTSILLVACASQIAFARAFHDAGVSWQSAAVATWRSAAPASTGIISMVGLSTLMDHSGMTILLAQALGGMMGAAYPVVSPLVGILGAFATGSCNNSNVLFGSMQQNAALLLGLDPRVLVAAQTTGGSLGSMIAPAKLIVGCSTVGLKGREGEPLRLTLPYGLLIGLGMGVVALLLTRL